MKLDRRWKAGVSLIAVLLFMLVATIAATATYKWLTSEGRSSGSRLQKQEAFQSSMAGLENIRAWMTYNANDVGALIKQYKDTGKKIKLNSRLTQWKRANQDYDVWLVGVNTGAAHNFKLKILSSGKSRGSAVHNEVAIFNVDGLFQVQIPEVLGGLNYDDAFAGESKGLTNTDTLESGNVHGDFTDKNNTPTLTKDFVVSGNAAFGGTLHAYGDMYVAGNIKSENGGYEFGREGVDTTVVYIGGDISCADNNSLKVHGDLQVDGKILGKCAIEVSGNLTVGGGIVRDNGGTKKFTVGKNLVFKKDAIFQWTDAASENSFGTGGDFGTGVGENTYLSNVEGQSTNDKRRMNLGSKIYLYNNFSAKACQNACTNAAQDFNCTNRCPKDDGPGGAEYCEGFFSVCHYNTGNLGNKDDRYFSFKAAGTNTAVQNKKILEWSKTDEVLKSVGSKYWERIAEMNNYAKIIRSDGTIPQELLLKNENTWKKLASSNNTYCGISKNWLWDDAAVQKLNDCYTKAKNEGKLHNGFLVIEWQYNQDQEPKTKKLDGKFVIYASTAVGNTYLPATEPDAVVMFYFEQGTDGNAQLKGRHTQNTDWVYNYFIYSDGDINELHNFNIVGSVFLAEGKKMNRFQGGNRLNFGENVVRSLITAGFIKENPEYTSLMSGASPTPGMDIEAAGGSDAYFIAAAPQLKITLESQYENNEPKPSEDEEAELSQSFIILPRIVYLPSNPYGYLKDYINLVNLNVTGTPLTMDITNVTGCTDIPKTSVLYDHANSSTATKLHTGLHECKYLDNGQSIPFYVYVTSDELGTKPFVEFDDINKEIGANNTENVNLDCKVGSGEEFKVKVTKPTDLSTAWTITPMATTEGPCDNASPSCTFKLHFNEADCSTPKTLFQVTTNDADYGSANFQITECVGCQIGTKYHTSIVLSSSFRVNRAGLLEYCSGPGAGTDECNTDGTYYQMMQATWPDCEAGDDAWVAAVGFNSSVTNNCTAYDVNESWNCGVSSDLKLNAIASGVPTGCEAIIPPESNNYLAKSSLTSGGEASLYAQLKAKKVHVRVKFAGEDLHAKTLYATSTRFPADRSCMYSDDGCDFELFTGDDFHITVSNSDKSDFSYWECDPAVSANCQASDSRLTGQTYSIEKVNGDNEITAWFGQKDKHCFFDEFKTSRECTGSGDDWKYCFNYCSGSGDCQIGDGLLTNHAKWLVLGDETLRNKLQYHDGKIWLDRPYNRDKKQSNFDALRVLSTVQAGHYGTMRAQFQVPQLGRGENEATAKVNMSGFMLRSNADASSYLMLNVFANKDGKLAAQVCIGDVCRTQNLHSTIGIGLHAMGTISSTDIVTMTAELKKEGLNDVLKVTVVKGRYGDYATATVTFTLSEIEGYTSLTGATNEYVGFSLADPDFKLYDIGWKSETFDAECWDTYPTLKCSFRAAYLGGIVPQGKHTKPWIGLSSWFDEKDCVPEYYYNGDDACGHAVTDGYRTCNAPEYYRFSESGMHGTIEDDVETKMAKVKIKECRNTALSEEDRGLLYAEEALCGQFWVGEQNVCKNNYLFFSNDYGQSLAPYSTSLSSDEIFALESGKVANLRSASISISMDNPNGEELEIYLRSETGYYNSSPKFSASAVTKARYSATIDVEELATSSGFDPEKVTAVIIRNHGSSNVTIKEVKSVCDNVTSVQCKDVVYSGGKFKVNVVVKHHEGVKSYVITATENGSEAPILGKTITCPGLACRLPDPAGRIAFDTDPYNPYQNGMQSENTYVFTVNTYGTDGQLIESSPCTMPELTLRPIQGECRWGGDASSVVVEPGKGLPDFQYKLPDCGGGNCKWVVSLDNSSDLQRGTGTVPQFSSLPVTKRNSFNTRAQPFTEGSEHKIYFKSTNDATTKFTECYKEFTVTGSSTASSSSTATSSSVVGSSSSTDLYSSAVVSSSSTEVTSSTTVPDVFTVTCPTVVNTYPVKQTTWGITTSGESALGDNESLVRDLYVGNSKISSKSCSKNDCQAMDDAYLTQAPGTYTYSVKIGSEEKCHGSLVVNNPIVCSDQPSDITLGGHFTVKASKASDAAGDPSECSLTGNGVSGGDCYNNPSKFNSNITVTPTSAGSQSYTYSVKLSNNGNTAGPFTCTWNVNVSSSSTSSESPCIEFVAGTGGYDKHCYNSGLLEMKPNTCYTLNTANVTDTQWPNNKATDTWWWKETPCIN